MYIKIPLEGWGHGSMYTQRGACEQTREPEFDPADTSKSSHDLFLQFWWFWGWRWGFLCCWCQSVSKFSETPCLKGIRLSITEVHTQTLPAYKCSHRETACKTCMAPQRPEQHTLLPHIHTWATCTAATCTAPHIHLSNIHCPHAYLLSMHTPPTLFTHRSTFRRQQYINLKTDSKLL